jgi:acyl-CoA synthetase (AMP-forming)/AMP-acid ligase II
MAGCAAALGLLWTASALAQDFSAQSAVDIDSVNLGDPIQFQIQVSGSDAPEEPDTSAITDFTVTLSGRGNNSTSSVTIIKNQREVVRRLREMTKKLEKIHEKEREKQKGGGDEASKASKPVEVEIVALDDPRRVLATNETGELRIRGPNVFRGYLDDARGDPGGTEAGFVDGWFLTGDVGRMDEAGFFFLTDRKKELIISGGFNVYPRAIEEAIHEHPAIAECAVIGVPDAYRGQAAKAFVVPRAGHQAPDLEALRGFLATRLGRHELPARLAICESLPRTPVGKVAQRVLVEAEAHPAGLAKTPNS